jgi:ADP-heptose:LPS heptosyltransferase
MMELELIISVDTSVAHLAGALGRPVWILLSAVPEWRWMLERSDTPWYGSARLFRQHCVGEWPALFAEVAAALEEHLRRMGSAAA